ncbi:DUF2268 domain-containing protein [Gracilibacillus caseinilyticus]|uniref:DUF2268 domain-containing protein n=1 Tax=Gracilibacillus caseinilyticus TaxID=2932256 RepID=A0ABY4F0F5_9BACI|nr:DUF2268 domain-containing putative Zn-dependent protease [Gracilibacillus caseinilyticus]UOQ49993.1 DUF2268 domain-containing protein [Gracilibacillus caseinilyticus]
MTIHKTTQWIDAFIKKKDQKSKKEAFRLQQSMLSKYLGEFFPAVEPSAIQQHLLQHGLFAADISENDWQEWKQQCYTQAVEKMYLKCKHSWKGPDTDIFIFPSNETIPELNEWFNGNAGLSFPDKLFLFLQKGAARREIAALVIHEYSHICRLHRFPKAEQDYTLEDAIMLEGIAEWLVRKMVGPSYGNKRVSLVTDKELTRLWKKWIEPNQQVTRGNAKHDLIMYGMRGAPKNLGYIIGFNVVHRFMKAKKCPATNLLHTNNENILNETSFHLPKN